MFKKNIKATVEGVVSTITSIFFTNAVKTEF